MIGSLKETVRVLPPDLQALSRREYAFVEAAADVMFPRGGALEPSGSDAGVARYMDSFVASQPRRLRVLIHLLFFLCEYAAVFFPLGGRAGFRPFTWLSPEARVRYLDSWRTSSWAPRRLVFTSLRAIVTLGYLADPAVLRALGLAPKAIESPACEADLLWPRVGERRDQLPYRREHLTDPSTGLPLALDAPLHPDYAEKRP